MRLDGFVVELAPTPPEPNAALLLIALGRRSRARVDELLAPHQIGYRHLAALGHLAGRQEISYSELARRASVTSQSMQATLSRLEESGVVKRVGSTGQGQRARLTVTPKGRRLLATCRQALSEVETEILSVLPAERREPLRGTLLELFSATATATTTTAQG
jgi:DNA-binding MarR family transcriptional regulator